MTIERLAAGCGLGIMAIVSFVAYMIAGGYPFLMVGSLFLTADFFLLGLET